MSDLETQSDDLRTSLESAFAEAEKPVETVKETVSETPVEPVETKADRARDESGKFAKVEAKEPPQDAVIPDVPVKRAPSSWKKETQAEWEKLPAHVQDDVLRRESDFHKGIETYKQAAARAQAYDQVIAPYQQTLQKMGVAPEAAIGALFKADHILRNSAPHEKAQYFAQLAQEYGIQLDQVQNPPQVDPAYQHVLNELQNLKASQQQDLYTRQQAEQAQLNSQIASFAEGKEHFDAVREDMAALLQAGRAKDLDAAYDMAIWARPDLRSGLLQQQTRAAEEKARAEVQKAKAQSASVSVRGSSPVSGQTATPDNLRAAIEAAFNT
jgi:hypothetical protein